jgi:hypothetical protein
MSFRYVQIIAAGIAAAALSACSTTAKSGSVEDTSLGEAKNMTMAAQIIDPDPQYEYLDPSTSGDHAAKAIDRYRQDRVKRPERVSSTESVGN